MRVANSALVFYIGALQPCAFGAPHPSFASAELVEARTVRAGTEYVVLRQSCRFTGLMPKHSTGIKAKVGQQVHYAAGGKNLYLRDVDGRVHKLVYISQELLPQPPPR